MPERQDLVAARVYLACVTEPPAPAVFRLVEQEGPVTAAELIKAGDVPEDVAEETRVMRHALQLNGLDFGDPERNIRVLIPEDVDEWPAQRLAPLVHDQPSEGQRPITAPLALWVRGDGSLRELLDGAVSITGSRAASSYGVHVSTDLGNTLGSHGVPVVSTVAYGVDEAAVRGTLYCGGKVVAVAPHGVDIAYPGSQASLISSVTSGGVLVSEHRPGSLPTRGRFIARSRLVAAFGKALVIPEAGHRSGTLLTARTAERICRPILAVPGPITSAASIGSNTLLRDGRARALTSVDDLLTELAKLNDGTLSLG